MYPISENAKKGLVVYVNTYDEEGFKQGIRLLNDLIDERLYREEKMSQCQKSSPSPPKTTASRKKQR
ncbi:MAG: hypothetical protein AB1556_07520 [Bacillota bacterium]